MGARSKPYQPQRILVVPLRYIGDTILTVPLLRNLRQQYPDACIHILSSKTAASLLETCPYIDDVLLEPKGNGKRLALLRQGHYDTVLILRKSVTMALMAKLAGIPVRIGYDKQRFPFGYKRWGALLNRSVRYPGLRTETPQAASHLGFLQALNAFTKVSSPQLSEAVEPDADPGVSLELWATPEDNASVDGLLGELRISLGDSLAIVHAASASHGKQIALKKFAPSIRLLREKGFRVLATGTASDVESYEGLRETEKLDFDIVAGKTTLRETYALYCRSKLIVTVDSSPIHLAAAAKIPKVVGIFGPTNEKQWGPAFNLQEQNAIKFIPVFMDLECRPCYAKVCEHNNCKELLTAGQIVLAVQQILAS